MDLDCLDDQRADRDLCGAGITLSVPSTVIHPPAQEAGSPPQQILGTGERKNAGERRQSGNNPHVGQI